MGKTIHLTQAGIDELKQELEELKVRRLEVAEKLRAARELGDLSENSDWSSAQDEHKFIEGRIAEIEHIMLNAQLIKNPRNGKEVQLGSVVTLKQNGTTAEYSIVGSYESNPEVGKISDESPIGKSLLGKKLGDSVDIKVPSGTTTYKIAKIA